MGKLKRQQIISTILLLLLSTLQWQISAHRHHKKHHPNSNDASDDTKCQLSTPEECDRMCGCNEPPRNCYYHFVVEHYMSQSGACASNATLAQCIYGDGTQKPLITINRQLPGPKIVVCKGDRIIVDVENRAEAASTTIHWHGLFQRGTPYMDGVPLLTQCPITEGSTFRYNFVANNSGTHMYHSHDGLQMMQGMVGVLTVREPKCTDPNGGLYDEDIHNLLATDMFCNNPPDHYPGKVKVPGASQTADSMFLNGKGPILGACPREPGVELQMEKVVVEHNKSYRVRFQNLCSTVCLLKICIEGHNITIIAIDGESVKPFTTKCFITGSGSRIDFIIDANKKIGTYWIYAAGLGECDGKVFQLAVVEYVGSTGPVTPQPQNYSDLELDGVTFNPVNITGCLNKSPDSICMYQVTCAEGKLPPEILKPKKQMVIPAVLGFDFPDSSEEFSDDNYIRYFAATFEGQPTSSIINNISNVDAASPPETQKEGYDSPIQTSCPSGSCFGRQVIRVPVGATVTIVICDKPGYEDLDHPMHLHGQSYYVLAQGLRGGGTCTPRDIQNILKEAQRQLTRGGNPCPPKADTVIVPQGGWVVLRYVADNPGMWLFHCHFTWHHLTGMSMVIQTGDEKDFPMAPAGFPTCGNFKPAIQCPVKNSWW